MRQLQFFSLLSLLLLLVACPAQRNVSEPELVITSTVTTSTEAVFTLEGTVKDNEAIRALTVKINDDLPLNITQALKDEAFSAAINLYKGKNTLVVTALNSAGGRTQKTHEITYTVNPSIAGHLWEDSNANGVQDTGEPNLAARTLYLDQNDNGMFDDGEITTQTDTDGKYSFTGLEPDRYIVRQILPFGERNLMSAGIKIAAQENLISVQSQISPQIVGGRDTTIEQFPFMVAVGSYFKGEEVFRQFCGATLISSRYVLTAAHCMAEQDPTNMRLLIASASLSNKDEKGKLLEVERLIIHPQYIKPERGYDIALIELKERLELTGGMYTAEPITPALQEFMAEGTMTTMTGWGALYSGATTPPDTLQMVHSRITNHDNCVQVYNALAPNNPLQNPETQLCAGVPEGGVDGCQGDSGGPLFVRGTIDAKPRWLLAGATSWGEGCGIGKYPGVWANVAVLYPWVVANAQEEGGVAKVIVRDGLVDAIDFANQKTTRPMTGVIVDRWQVTALGFQDNTALRVKNQAIPLDWTIIQEGNGYNYACTLNIKVQGGADVAAQQPPCSVGKNSYNFTEGFSNGIYEIALAIQARDTDQVTQTRTMRVLIANSKVSGELTKEDLVDPDYNLSQYYIDYYDFTGVPVGTKVEIQHMGLAKSALVLYDKAKRKPTGGILLSAGDEQNSPLVFTVEEGVDYLVGISSADSSQTTGNYELASTVGTLTPSNFAK